MRHLTPVHRGVAALAAAAVGLSLAPAGASAAESGPAPEAAAEAASDAAAESATVPTTTVRLKVARQDRRTVETTAQRPWPLLHAEEVPMSRRDLVRVIRDGDPVPYTERRRLRDGDTVKVIRVDVLVKRDRERIPRRTVTRTVDHLAPGVRRVVRKGRPGVRVVRVRKTLHNYRRVDRDVRRHVVRKPRTRRVLVGRRYGSVPGADHLRWGALAQCESSGNPRAVNPAGYYGLYQFDVSTWRSVGGSGMPHHASPTEQTYRAKLLYKQRGRSPWPNCGRLL